MGLVMVAGALLLFSPAVGFAERVGVSEAGWWNEEPLRILIARCNDRYRPQPTTSEQLREIREAGFNIYGARWHNTDPSDVEATLERCEAEGLGYAPWMRGSKGNEDDPEKMVVWDNGEVQPLYGPLAPELWSFLEERIGYYAELSVDSPVVGVMLDFENYAENKQGNLYYTISYDIYSLGRYAEERGVEGPPADLEPQDAREWVVEQPDEAWADYEAWFRAQFRERARALRESVDEHNPRFLFMVYHSPGLTGEIAAAEWSTDDAPFVALGVDYGRRFPALSERINLMAIERRIANRIDSWREQEDVNALVTGGTLPGYRGSDAEYSAKKASILARDGDGYWVWHSRAESDEFHDAVMDWYGRAGADIEAGTYAIADLPRQEPEPEPEVEIQQPDHVQVAILGDMRGGIREFIDEQVDGFEPHRLQGSTPDYLGNFDLVILQRRTGAPEAGIPEFHGLLREYVEEGGAVLLAWDTISNLGSPFPDIVEGMQPPEAIEETGSTRAGRQDQIRHRTRRLATDDPALTEGIDTDAYSAHYMYHYPMVAGNQGNVVTRNRYDMPVMVVGRHGQGAVGVTGDFLARRRPPDGTEAHVLEAVLRHLVEQTRSALAPPGPAIDVQADRGAAGDGEADDTQAIQEAFDAVQAGEAVVFPPGDYRVSSTLTIAQDEITIVGEDATLVAEGFPGFTDYVARIEGNGVTIDGLGITSRDGRGSGYRIVGDDVHIANAVVRGVFREGFRSGEGAGNRARLTNCRVQDVVRRDGYRLEGQDWIIENCEARNIERWDYVVGHTGIEHRGVIRDSKGDGRMNFEDINNRGSGPSGIRLENVETRGISFKRTSGLVMDGVNITGRTIYSSGEEPVKESVVIRNLHMDTEAAWPIQLRGFEQVTLENIRIEDRSGASHGNRTHVGVNVEPAESTRLVVRNADLIARDTRRFAIAFRNAQDWSDATFENIEVEGTSSGVFRGEGWRDAEVINVRYEGQAIE